MYILFPHNPLVFKVSGKIFALLGLERQPQSVSLKCDPELAIKLREKHRAVDGAYHMNKKHWNGIVLDGSITNSVMKNWVDHSYELVVAKPTKKEKAVLENEE